MSGSFLASLLLLHINSVFYRSDVISEVFCRHLWLGNLSFSIVVGIFAVWGVGLCAPLSKNERKCADGTRKELARRGSNIFASAERLVMCDKGLELFSLAVVTARC